MSNLRDMTAIFKYLKRCQIEVGLFSVVSQGELEPIRYSFMKKMQAKHLEKFPDSTSCQPAE